MPYKILNIDDFRDWKEEPVDVKTAWGAPRWTEGKKKSFAEVADEIVSELNNQENEGYKLITAIGESNELLILHSE